MNRSFTARLASACSAATIGLFVLVGAASADAQPDRMPAGRLAGWTELSISAPLSALVGCQPVEPVTPAMPTAPTPPAATPDQPTAPPGGQANDAGTTGVQVDVDAPISVLTPAG